MLVYICSRMLSPSRDVLFKLSETTSLQKLFQSDCITLFLHKISIYKLIENSRLVISQWPYSEIFIKYSLVAAWCLVTGVYVIKSLFFMLVKAFNCFVLAGLGKRITIQHFILKNKYLIFKRKISIAKN